jgi:hypothetical protein
MDELRRLNHWVPASYLAAFTDTGRKDGLLRAYRRDAPSRTLSLPPHAVAKERDLYVVESPEARLDDSIERMLADYIEGPFVPVRNHLVYGRAHGLTGRLSESDKDALAFFLAFQQVRTPRFRENVNLLATFQGNLLARSHFQDLEKARHGFEAAHDGTPFTLEEVAAIRDALENGDIIIEPTDKHWLEVAMRIALDLRPVIRALPRKIVSLGEDANLPTCDEPVVPVRRVSMTEYRHGGGLNQADVEITLILSPNTVLVLGDSVGRYRDHGTPEWVEQVRERTVSAARQWVFAREEDSRVPTILGRSRPPTNIIEFPGGSLRPGESAHAAVRVMMERNPGEAIIRAGPER